MQQPSPKDILNEEWDEEKEIGSSSKSDSVSKRLSSYFCHQNQCKFGSTKDKTDCKFHW